MTLPRRSTGLAIPVAAIAVGVLAAGALALSHPAAAAAHVDEQAGSFHVLVGWHVEPVYVGQPDAVEITITDSAGKPVDDLGADDLHVTVATAGQTSPDLSFEPAFDTEEGTGVEGQYVAGLVPTAVGDYTFHISGTIHGTNVDLTAASGDETFNAVVGTSDIEFPAKLPTMAEVATHLDRIDARVEALQSGAPADGATNGGGTTSDAGAADRALLIGGGLGVLGLLVAIAALGVALGSRGAASHA